MHINILKRDSRYKQRGWEKWLQDEHKKKLATGCLNMYVFKNIKSISIACKRYIWCVYIIILIKFLYITY